LAEIFHPDHAEDADDLHVSAIWLESSLRMARSNSLEELPVSPFFVIVQYAFPQYLWSQVSEFLENYIQNLKLDSTNILFQIQLQLYFPQKKAHTDLAKSPNSRQKLVPVFIQSLANMARFFQDNN